MDPAAPNHYARDDASPHPASGIRLYFGNDDNIAGGEHDGTSGIHNGASDGGGFHVVLDPASVWPWMHAFMHYHPRYILTHPLPVGDAGIGFCVDGTCFSAQTQRQVAYQGGADSQRDAADYSDPHTWDQPAQTCNGGDAGQSCQNPDGSNGLTYWNNRVGTTYDEPGVQIYEDPDPEGSPVFYPLPALYVGTCGVIIGGGLVQFPASPLTNGGGQIDLQTGC
jgi:hypothetical protein